MTSRAVSPTCRTLRGTFALYSLFSPLTNSFVLDITHNFDAPPSALLPSSAQAQLVTSRASLSHDTLSLAVAHVSPLRGLSPVSPSSRPPTASRSPPQLVNLPVDNGGAFNPHGADQCANSLGALKLSNNLPMDAKPIAPSR